MTAATPASIVPHESVGGKTLTVDITSTDSGATFSIDLNDYGLTTLLGITGWVHTTSGSVVAMEDPTTSVSGTTVTVTVGGTAVGSKRRVYKIDGR